MGVRNLNKLINSYCKQAINVTHLSMFRGKTLCIDAMIYLYKYKTDDSLLENIYLMCTIFHYYNIKPIFVFDGAPPKEKVNEINIRKEKRKDALEKFNNMTEEEINNMSKKSYYDLKRQIVKINRNNIENVKNLLDCYGIHHITSVGEADSLLVELVLKKKAYACISDDMDLFVYGCPRVLRHFSLFKHNVLFYDTKLIYKLLNITNENFKWICILSGTDYYKNKNNKNLFFHLNLYRKYMKKNSNLSFYEWLIYKNIIFKKDDIMLKEVYNLFNIKNELNIKKPFKWKRIDKHNPKGYGCLSISYYELTHLLVIIHLSLDCGLAYGR